MEDITGAFAVEGLIKQKHACEKEMAEAILTAIDDSPDQEIRGALRALVLNSVENMEDIISAKGEAAFQAAYDKESKNPYPFMKRANLANSSSSFLAFLKNTDNIFDMDTEACGNMIRFFGEVIEAGVKIPASDESKAIKEELDRLNKLRESLQKSDDPRKPEWTKSTPALPPSDLVMRNRIPTAPNKLKGEDDNYFKWREAAIRDYRLKRSKVERQLADSSGGISLFVQLDEDLLARMNKVFGLIHGATISGTTTDTLFFLNRMALVDLWSGAQQPANEDFYKAIQAYYEGWDYNQLKQGKTVKIPHAPRGLDPLYYLIPLACIVGKGHHTVLEFAIPLTQNNKMNYVIGKYTSLLSERRDEAGDTKAMFNILAKYENDYRNKNILVYYTPQKQYEGYVIFGKDEAVWDEIALANQNLLNKFKTFATHPTKEQVASLHPRLEELLLKRKQIRTGAERDFEARRSAFGPHLPHRNL